MKTQHFSTKLLIGLINHKVTGGPYAEDDEVDTPENMMLNKTNFTNPDEELETNKINPNTKKYTKDPHIEYRKLTLDAMNKLGECNLYVLNELPSKKTWSDTSLANEFPYDVNNNTHPASKIKCSIPKDAKIDIRIQEQTWGALTIQPENNNSGRILLAFMHAPATNTGLSEGFKSIMLQSMAKDIVEKCINRTSILPLIIIGDVNIAAEEQTLDVCGHKYDYMPIRLTRYTTLLPNQENNNAQTNKSNLEKLVSYNDKLFYSPIKQNEDVDEADMSMIKNYGTTNKKDNKYNLEVNVSDTKDKYIGQYILQNPYYSVLTTGEPLTFTNEQHEVKSDHASVLIQILKKEV
ncbi:hypothetical protein Trichorick_01605 (plasmid) [Candidatus Trichorickettsia mobilis]|uniref:hypothetical protein n=1 Tax=Candidatus Trichorickettsia mobilis TaxID=1346319 RepID=UPI002B262735|nr:hypothetical protein [Candidatus Trichorickettsia mobilis]WPY01687.1 hypothetical protein Trichorick_01605 [Candidatus Trichorickettsia mobilis]